MKKRNFVIFHICDERKKQEYNKHHNYCDRIMKINKNNWITYAYLILFQKIENRAQISTLISAPFNTYMGLILASVEVDGTVAFDKMTDNLLQCHSLSEGIRSFLLVCCGASGLNSRLFAWSLLISMAVLFTFLSFTGIFNLWCCQNNQIKRFSKAQFVN